MEGTKAAVDSGSSAAGDWVGLALTLLWPAAATVSLAIAVGGNDVTMLGLALLASGTTAAYGLDRFIDRRGADSQPIRIGLAIAVVCASTVAGTIALTALWRLQVCMALGVLAGGYVPIKRSIPKNALTVPAWTVAVAALPFDEAPDFSGRYAAAAGAIALIMTANTVLCDLGDIESDRAAGVIALAARFGARTAAAFAGGAALIGVVVACGAGKWSLALTALSLAALALVLGQRSSRRWARLSVDGVVTLLPGPLWYFIG